MRVYYIVKNVNWPPYACGLHGINSRHLIENNYHKLRFIVKKEQTLFFFFELFSSGIETLGCKVLKILTDFDFLHS